MKDFKNNFLEFFNQLTMAGKIIITIIGIVLLIIIFSFLFGSSEETVEKEVEKETDKTYAEKMRRKRIEKGYTVEMLADSLKILPSLLNGIEDGKAEMLKNDWRWERYEQLLK